MATTAIPMAHTIMFVTLSAAICFLAVRLFRATRDLDRLNERIERLNIVAKQSSVGWGPPPPMMMPVVVPGPSQEPDTVCGMPPLEDTVPEDNTAPVVDEVATVEEIIPVQVDVAVSPSPSTDARPDKKKSASRTTTKTTT